MTDNTHYHMQVKGKNGNLLYGSIISEDYTRDSYPTKIIEGEGRGSRIDITGPFSECHNPYSLWYFPVNIFWGKSTEYWQAYKDLSAK